MNMRYNSNKGITMIELMIVVVIVGIVAAMAVPRFKNAYERMQFRSANRDIVSKMRLARSMAISNKQNIGVSFDVNGTTVTLFQKDSLSTVINLLEVTDSIIKVDSMAQDMEYVTTDLTNHTLTYRPNGSAEFTGGGNIVTLANTGDMIGIYQINVLASTGKITSTGYYY